MCTLCSDIACMYRDTVVNTMSVYNAQVQCQYMVYTFLLYSVAFSYSVTTVVWEKFGVKKFLLDTTYDEN